MFLFSGHRTELFAFPDNFVRLGIRNAFVKIFVAHHHRRHAATSEALDEFDRELAILRRLQTVRVRVKAKLGAKMFVQLVRAADGTAQGATNFDLMFADRRLPEHRVECHELMDVDGLKSQFARDPLRGFG